MRRSTLDRLSSTAGETINRKSMKKLISTTTASTLLDVIRVFWSVDLKIQFEDLQYFFTLVLTTKLMRSRKFNASCKILILVLVWDELGRLLPWTDFFNTWRKTRMWIYLGWSIP